MGDTVKELPRFFSTEDVRKILSEDTGINKYSKNKKDEYKSYDAVIIIGEDYLTFND